ncbi:MAG: hypothetical protein BGO68_04810 [Candidatus Amoebophilus sp. 36-38]|nr:MAG: hypothetical protein BGO68_04810 [Candidatus Amoebophilus sp. 36-38]
MEVDAWTRFTKHFTHIKNGGSASDKHLLLTAILSDAINLGLKKMAIYFHLKSRLFSNNS